MVSVGPPAARPRRLCLPDRSIITLNDDGSPRRMTVGGQVFFLDSAGLPLSHLNAWYRLWATQWAGTLQPRTRETYAACLFPVFRWLAARGIAWDAPVRQVREALARYFREELGLVVDRGEDALGSRWVDHRRQPPSRPAATGCWWPRSSTSTRR